jgi:hypothetical protein
MARVASRSQVHGEVLRVPRGVTGRGSRQVGMGIISEPVGTLPTPQQFL